MQLRELQEQWKNYIFQQQMDFIRPIIAGESSEEGLHIYANAYESRLLDVLEKIFPCLCKYMGEEKFFQIAANYLHQYPSRDYSIIKIGKLFPLYLKNVLISEVYAEIAQLEWAINQAIDAGNSLHLFTVENLQKIPQDKWSSLIFILHPSLEIMHFNANPVRIYQGNTHTALQEETSYCRVWRKGLQVYYLNILKNEYIFLSEIQKRKSFGEICEILAEIMPEEKVIQYAVQQLQRWLIDEIISGVEVTS